MPGEKIPDVCCDCADDEGRCSTAVELVYFRDKAQKGEQRIAELEQLVAELSVEIERSKQKQRIHRKARDSR